MLQYMSACLHSKEEGGKEKKKSHWLQLAGSVTPSSAIGNVLYCEKWTFCLFLFNGGTPVEQVQSYHMASNSYFVKKKKKKKMYSAASSDELVKCLPTQPLPTPACSRVP